MENIDTNLLESKLFIYLEICKTIETELWAIVDSKDINARVRLIAIREIRKTSEAQLKIIFRILTYLKKHRDI